MNWTRKRGKNYDEIVSGPYHIHRSLDRFTAYRVNPFERYGIFNTAEEAKKLVRFQNEDLRFMRP